MALKKRKPNGQASWPTTLLAGKQGSGKSYGIALASASPRIGQTLWIPIGERDPEEFALVRDAEGNPARFEIVEHDGTYASILQAVRDAVAEPTVDGKPNLIAVDSMTRLWMLIQENAQATANRRAKTIRNPQTGDFSITADLWNEAASQWSKVITPLLTHQGPVIFTARLDEVAVMENGAPTPQKTWKVQAHKSLPFDVDAEVHMYSRGEFVLNMLKSVANPLDRPRPVPDFTVPWLWEQIGVEGMGGVRRVSQTRTDESAAPAQRPAGVPRPQQPPQPKVRAKPSGRKWVEEGRAAKTKEQLRLVFLACRDAGELSAEVEADLMKIAATLPEEESGEWAEAKPAGTAWTEPAAEEKPAEDPAPVDEQSKVEATS
jgi:hypothetical protein